MMCHKGTPQEDKAREEPARAVGWGGGSVADNVVLVRLIAVPARFDCSPLHIPVHAALLDPECTLWEGYYGFSNPGSFS